MGQVESQSGLGNGFGAGVRMVVDAQAGVNGEPRADVLTEIDVSGYFVQSFPPKWK